MEEKKEEMAKDRVISIDIPNLTEQPRSIGENFISKLLTLEYFRNINK